MSTTWPLRGRDAEVDALRSMLSDPASGGLVLCGEPGVGKSRLVAEGARQARSRGHAVVSVRATQAGAGIPLGALVAVLDQGDLTATASLDALVAVRQRLGQLAAGRRLVLTVDDGHLLDPASASAINQLATDGAASVLMTLRTGAPAPDAVTALWKDDVVRRIEVDALGQDVVEALLADVLGGPVDPAAARRLHAVAGGNPLYLRELVRGALDDGVLAAEGGIWSIHGTLAPTGRLIELIELRLSSATEEARRLVTALALAGPLAADVLEHIGIAHDAAATRRTLSEAERSGLVSTHIGRVEEVQLGHPLFGEVMRATMPLLEQRALCHQLATAKAAGGVHSPADALAIAVLQLTAGDAPPPDLALLAARGARAALDLDLAEHLATIAVAGGSNDARLVLGEVLHYQGRYAEAEATFARIGDAGGDQVRASTAQARSFNLFWGLGDVAGAQTILREARAEVTDHEHRGLLDADAASLLLFSGDPSTAAEQVAAVLAAPDVTDRVVVRAAFPGAPALVQLGRGTEGLALAERGIASAERLRPSLITALFHLMLHACRAYALTELGRLGEASEAAAESMRLARAAGSTSGVALAEWSRGRVALQRGAVAVALDHLERGAVVDGALALAGRRRWSLHGAALAAALGGDGAAADAVLERAAALPPSPDRFTSADASRARAWAAVARGQIGGALAILRSAAAQEATRGNRAGELALIHDLARLGGAGEVAERSAVLSGAMDGALAVATAEHIRGLAQDDPADLTAAARSFEAAGALLLAAEAASAAAHAHRRRGETVAARGVDRHAGSLAARCPGARTPALLSGPQTVTLTAREREVVMLVARGMTSREVAEHLVVSIRTVDNHLQHAYSKLGITGRHELAAAISVQSGGAGMDQRA